MNFWNNRLISAYAAFPAVLRRFMRFWENSTQPRTVHAPLWVQRSYSGLVQCWCPALLGWLLIRNGDLWFPTWVSPTSLGGSSWLFVAYPVCCAAWPCTRYQRARNSCSVRATTIRHSRYCRQCSMWIPADHVMNIRWVYAININFGESSIYFFPTFV